MWCGELGDMKGRERKGIFIESGRKIWPHEMRVAKLLVALGHDVVFLEESSIHRADILLDGVEFEIKSPRSANSNSLEHLLKKALRQSSNIIVDMSRIKNCHDDSFRRFLITQARNRKQIKRLIMITKKGQVIDIDALI